MNDFKKISNKISQITLGGLKEKDNIVWTNIIDAGDDEINFLQSNYDFNLSHLEASAATVFSQRPMIAREKKYFFIILHFPVLINGKIIAGEIEFFISHGYLITVHNNNVPALIDFFSNCSNDKEYLNNYNIKSSIILLYDLLNCLINDCYKLIDNTSLDINRVEDLIFSKKSNAATNLILNLRRNIINLRKILQNHKHILGELTEVKSGLISQSEIKTHYNNLVDHSDRIWTMLDNQKEMIEALNNTNQSLLDNEMSKVMKTLTIFSVIVFPLTLLATMFSMSVPGIPFANNPHAFWIVSLIIGGLGVIMLLFFVRKRWL
ncbi:MAG: magnesium transporter CorA family protein [Candidatus Falkowbacteria bacterium]